MKTKVRRVYVVSGTYWYVEDLPERKTNGKPKQKWHRLTRVAEGEAAKHAALSKLFDEAPSGFNQAVADFLADHLKTLTPNSEKEYRRNFAVIAEAFSQFHRVDQIKPKHVRAFLRQFDDVPTARHHYRGRLSTFFAWCVVEDLIRTNPCRELRLPGPPKRTVKMTPDVYWRIRDAMLGTDKHPCRWGAMHQCALDLYYLLHQRGTDVRLLEWQQVGKDSIRCTPSKTSKTTGVQVDIPITPEIASVLDRARSLGKIKSPRYVLHTEDGGPFSANGIRTAFKRAMHRAGLQGYTLKDIRPMAATAAEKEGYTTEDLRKGLGHSSVTTTEIYLRDRTAVESPVRLRLPKKPKT